jgi:lysophospholipase L1-like esterase
VAYGSSITAHGGYLAGVVPALTRAYPAAQIELQRIGRTGFDSVLAAFDARSVIAHTPDLVFVEFAVNDHAAGIKPFIAAALHGIVAQIRAALPACEFVFVYHGRIIDGARAERTQIDLPESVADALGAPSIDVDELSAGLVALGQATYLGDSPDALTTDGTHPTGERLIGIPFAEALLAIVACEGEPASQATESAPIPTFDGETFCRLMMERHQLPDMSLFNGIVVTPAEPAPRGARDVPSLFERARTLTPKTFAVSGAWADGAATRVVASMYHRPDLLVAQEAGATLRVSGCARFAVFMGFSTGTALDVRIDGAATTIVPQAIVSPAGQSVWPLLVVAGLDDRPHTIEVVASSPLTAFSEIYTLEPLR